MFKNKIFIAIFSLFIISCSDSFSPDNIEINIDAPILINKGESFTITATVINTSTKPQKLKSVDIGNNYLESIVIVNTTPEYTDIMDVPLVNTTSYVFNKTINPNSEIIITFDAKALSSGTYKSTVDFFINSDFNFLTKQIFTEIK